MAELLKPSPEDISGIIEKFENLKTQSYNLEKTPLDFPKGEEIESLIIKRLANAASRQSETLSADQLFAPSEILRKLPSLSVATLETLTELLNKKISRLKTQDKIQELQKVQYFAKLELEKKVKEAKAKRWAHDISPLIAEIDLDLTPWRPYLLSICAALGQFDANLLYVGPFIEHAEFSRCLDPIIHDLKRIKRIREKELEADLATTKQVETKQNATPTKHWKIIAWFKGLSKELYGLTIERITKAYLDKYG